MLKKHELQAMAIRKRTPQVLQARGLDAPIQRWELVDAGDLVLLFGTVNTRRLDRLERYTSARLVHHLSTVCGGMGCCVVNTSGLRYAFVLRYEQKRLPKQTDFPGCERGKVRLGLDADGKDVTTTWERMGHLLVAGMTGAGKSNFLRLLAHQAIAEGARLALADVDGRTFPMLTDNPALFEPIATTPEDAHQVVARALAECDRRSVLYGTVSGYPDKLEDYNAEAVRGDAERLPRLLVILDEFNATALAQGGANGDFCGDVATLAWRGRKFGVNLVVAAQDFAMAIIGRMRDQVMPVLFKVNNDALARKVRLSEAMELPRQPGLAVTRQWGRMQTYFLPKSELASGQPAILTENEAVLVAWVLEENSGYMGLSEIREYGDLGQGAARRLAADWERRGWLAKDASAGNKRRVTAEFEAIAYKLKSLQTLQTPRDGLQTDLQTARGPPTSLQTAYKPVLPPFLAHGQPGGQINDDTAVCRI